MQYNLCALVGQIKYLLFLSDGNEIRKLSTGFRAILKYQIS